MIDPMLRDQYARTLDELPAAAPWPVLEDSGFLDLLAPADRGGAALPLDALFELAIETARRPNPPPIVETMLVRLLDPKAVAIEDPESGLIAAGMERPLARSLAGAAAAAQIAGAVHALIEMTIDYAGTRQQFGRPIGKFQAVQQQLAVAVEEAHAAYVTSRAALAGPPDAIDRQRVAVAKIRAGQAAHTVAAIAHAVHGAIGISAEHALHQFTRRLHGWRMAHGGEAWWAAQLGQWMIAGDGDFITAIRDVSTVTDDG